MYKQLHALSQFFLEASYTNFLAENLYSSDAKMTSISVTSKLFINLSNSHHRSVASNAVLVESLNILSLSATTAILCSSFVYIEILKHQLAHFTRTQATQRRTKWGAEMVPSYLTVGRKALGISELVNFFSVIGLRVSKTCPVWSRQKVKTDATSHTTETIFEGSSQWQ